MMHALYRYYADDGVLLYVGITNDMSRRMDQHAADKGWWQEVRGVTVEWYDTRDAVLAAERRAIAVEQPRHNVVHRRRAKPIVRTARGQASAELVWTCGVCAEPVSNGEGYIHVKYASIERYERDVRNRRAAARAAQEDPEAPVFWSLADMDKWEWPAAWQVHHRRCDPDGDSNDYWFDVARARTQAHLIDWTAHLLEKSWLPSTNWASLLRGVMRDNKVGVSA